MVTRPQFSEPSDGSNVSFHEKAWVEQYNVASAKVVPNSIEMLARFQQKQLQEKEQKLLQLYDQQQQRAHQVAQRGSAGSNGSSASNNVGASAAKVKQLLASSDDRRQQNGFKGIDKSYPLDPLKSKKTSPIAKPTKSNNNNNNNNMTNRKLNSNVNVSTRRVIKADVNSNLSSSSSRIRTRQHENFSRESYVMATTTSTTSNSSTRYNSEATATNGSASGESIRQVNGHAKNGYHYEINIDDVIDNEALQRNRMLAKFQPGDIERRRRQLSGTAIATDIDDEFPVEYSQTEAATSSSRKSSLKNAKSNPQIAAAVAATKKTSTTTTTIPSGTSLKKADSIGKVATETKNVVTPYPSSRSPDGSEKPSRSVVKSTSLKLLSKFAGSNGDVDSIDHLPRKSSIHTLENDEKLPAKAPITPAPRTSPSSSSNLLSSSRSQGSRPTNATTGKKTPTPAARTTAPSSANADDSLITCKICTRRFQSERIVKHEQICAKTAQKKRKQFDAVGHRVRGTELESFVQKPNKKGKAAVAASTSTVKPESQKSNWRRKHEDFINAIRSAKQMQAHLAAGGKLSDLPPPPPTDTSDYVQCPHCSRKFNQGVAERHIPKCETMQHNKPKPRPKR